MCYIAIDIQENGVRIQYGMESNGPRLPSVDPEFSLFVHHFSPFIHVLSVTGPLDMF